MCHSGWLQLNVVFYHIKFCLQGGFYIFSLLENYAAGLSLLVTVFFEAVAVSWVYGLKNFSEDVYAMLGHRPGLYWKICWKFISPTFLAVSIYDHDCLRVTFAFAVYYLSANDGCI